MTQRHAGIAVIGAGPYGLSLSAHLTARGLTPAVFGRPMESWRYGTPPGMRLKSEGFASSLSDPTGELTLKSFCQSSGLAYSDTQFPTPIGTFVAYGEAFQRRFAPQLDTRMARQIRKSSAGFEIELEDGEKFATEQCALATGLTGFEHLPPPLQDLPRDRVAHTAWLSDYTRFAGARVLVVGAGASATNAAGELLRCGAEVTLTCRGKALRFYAGAQNRTWRDALTAPLSPIGPGWSKWAASRFPQVFHALPERLRVKIVDRTMGPAPAWFVRDEIEGKIAVEGGQRIVAARATASGVQVDRIGADGAPSTTTFDFVIAGSGYKVDLDRLTFLSPSLRAELKRVGGSPKLSRDFESSIPGLYFLGVTAAYHFGPAFRFVCGADYASRRVSSAILAKSSRRRATAQDVPARFRDARLPEPSRGGP